MTNMEITDEVLLGMQKAVESGNARDQRWEQAKKENPSLTWEQFSKEDLEKNPYPPK